MFGGFAGAFFATRQGFISPNPSLSSESALVLAIVVLGGMGSQIGVALAALIMIGGFELFRELRAVPHAGVRPRHGADHDLAAARADSATRGRPCTSARRRQAIAGRPGQGRATDERRATRSSASTT